MDDIDVMVKEIQLRTKVRPIPQWINIVGFILVVLWFTLIVIVFNKIL